MIYEEVLNGLEMRYGMREDVFYRDLAFYMQKEYPSTCERATNIEDVVNEIRNGQDFELVDSHAFAMLARLHAWTVFIDEERIDDHFEIIAKENTIRFEDGGSVWERRFPLGEKGGQHEVFIVDGTPWSERGKWKKRPFNNYACDFLGIIEYVDDLFIYLNDAVDMIRISKWDSDYCCRMRALRALPSGIYEVYKTVYGAVIISRVDVPSFYEGRYYSIGAPI